MSALVDNIIRLSGLSPIFAKTAIRRAFRRAGVDPDAAQPADLERAWPELERALSVYLGHQAAGLRIREMKSGLAAR